MSKPFKCQLFPNKQVEPEDMQYPLIASHKLDGCRMIFNKGELQSRSGKPIVNKQIHKKYSWLKDITGTLDIVLDGEFYSPTAEFSEISSVFRSHDKVIPEDMEFWAFDIGNHPSKYQDRIADLLRIADNHNIKVPDSFMCHNPEQVRSIMEQALEDGYEGLILLSPRSKYKNGRITVPSGDGYKLKPYRTFDSKILSVVQASEVDPNAEKTINELGYSETSKKKGDRIPVDKAAAFEVQYEKGSVYVVLAMTDEEKEEVWQNREDYIGRTVEWKGLCIGMKDVPRHPITIRMRPDKDE